VIGQAPKASQAMNWITVAESGFPWERDALEFVRSRFPAHEPYRAWSNFEFIADDGSINEVDLLVFSPEGLFLIEIKSRPGRLFGDAGTWSWETDGRLFTYDNPLIAANNKAKKLRSLLQRQRACKSKGQVPYVEPLVFVSAPDLVCQLQGTAANRVCLRDREESEELAARPGILAAITRRECRGLEPHPKGTHDRPTAKMVSQAIDQAGIRPSQRHRKVSDYQLEQVIGDGPGYQDWLASHVRVTDTKRRVRLYHVRNESSKEEREKIERAALREFQILETLQHPGVLRIYGFSEHVLGPALIFEHDPISIRLDHLLAQRRDSLPVDVRLDLMRQIAEVVRFAHDKKVVHRGLCPQSILVCEPSGPRPKIKLFNWQLGYREASSTGGVSRAIAATSHVDRFVDDASTAYMAPEAISEEGGLGEHLDVFSLGAIAYHLFSGVAPAANGLELSNKLRETKGLQISSVLNGAGANLQDLIQFATHPEVTSRIDTVADFLTLLDAVEDELTAPEHNFVSDPNLAQKGDLLPGHLTVVRRLGQGACSIALLVERDGQEYVLKAASDPEQNARVRDEAEVLQKLRHQHIVEFCEPVEMGDFAGFLMRPVLVDKDDRRIETLGQRLRKEGRLHIDLLQRFGDDLLDVLNYLQEQGIHHRDIKPDNIAVGRVGRGDTLHVVLFDFSLSRTPVDNIRAGTSGYLDPLLPLRKPARWDLNAERYAAAITLYELATGTMPKWGDGATDPSHLNCEITIDPELFDPNLRDRLSEFFRKAFRRDPSERFDNAEEMLRAWRVCFENIDEPGSLSDHEDEESLKAILADATFDTHIHELHLGTRATNALDRANLLTVEDLLTVPMRRLLRLRGVGNKTRKEIGTAVRILRERLGSPTSGDTVAPSSDEGTRAETGDPGSLSVDLLLQRILPKSKAGAEAKAGEMIRALLGLDATVTSPWASQTDVAEVFKVTRARVSQVVGKFQARWAKESSLTKLRADLATILESSGGAMSVAELADALLVARGSVEDEPLRTRIARAVVRAALEVERSMGEPRYQLRREGERILVALNPELASYALRLGEAADRMAEEDPLLPPSRVLQRLREIARPAGSAELSDSRLVRLAVAAAGKAALSSRQELYPRGMDAGRALRLSQGALYGVSSRGGVASLTVQEIRDRVLSRYPEAESVPDHPALDALLEEMGFDFRWDPGVRGVGGYVTRIRDTMSVTSASESVSRQAPSLVEAEDGALTPEIADSRQFEEKLRNGLKEGSFYALLVNPKYYQRACRALCRRFPVELVDFEGLFLDALRQVADKAKVQWDVVLRADSKRSPGDWEKLKLLVGRAIPLVEARLLAVERPVLLVYAGLLARYERMDLLERLRDKVGRRDGIPGLWVLIPADHHALLDGKAVPIIGPGQRARIPEGWAQTYGQATGSGLASLSAEHSGGVYA
jgi:serine/threonine protein kinase